MTALALNMVVVLSAGLIVYTYAGYPILIALLAKSKPARLDPDSSQQPRVTVIIPTHKAHQFLEAKLDSLRRQSYPADLMQFMVISDGIDEATRSIVNTCSDVLFLELAERAGKPSALNLAREHLPETTEVVVLTDVRQTLSANAVADLVAALSDPKVGVAGGELVQVQPDGSEAPIGLYWRYEKAIRRSESTFFSTVGASGALYAIAAKDFGALESNTILDDFELPIRTLRKGQRTILVDGAVVYDQAETKISGEWHRKVRTLTGNFQSLRRNPWLISPATNPAWLQFMSHKLARLIVPWAMLALWASCLIHPATVVQAFGWLQGLFYAAAVAALIWPQLSSRVKLLGISATFVALNVAAMIALMKFLRGSTEVTWKQTRNDNS